ncbi:MAG: recombination protein RecR [Marivivens sp.]|nr:recombination protein RecR [Marivivens sp.]
MAQGPQDIEDLIGLLSKLPGLGPRSARRAVLHLIKKRKQHLIPLADAMTRVGQSAKECLNCGNIDTADICPICQDERRANGEICIVEDVADLWAMERSGVFKTIDGQTTAHYIADQLPDVTVTSLAQGVPVGGELDYLDDGTITAALRARRSL